MMRLGARPDEVDFFQGILFCSKIDLTIEQSLIVHLPPSVRCLQSLFLILALAFKHTHLVTHFRCFCSERLTDTDSRNFA